MSARRFTVYAHPYGFQVWDASDPTFVRVFYVASDAHAFAAEMNAAVAS
jgi:hypothetical protein